MKEGLKPFIKRVIADVGTRTAGSEGEASAAEIIAGEFRERGAEASIQRMPTYPEHLRALIRILTYSYLAAVVVYPLFPIATVVITFSALALLLLGRKVSPRFIDFFLKAGETQNVVGIYGAKGEKKKTLIFSGHHDSPYMMPLLSPLYKRYVHWIENGVVLGLILTIPAGVARAIFAGPVITLYDFSKSIGWWDILFPVIVLGLLLAIFFRAKMLTNEKNLGANDNLSAVAVLIGLGDYLKGNGLKNTEVWLVSFGSEEVFGYGSNGFAEAHRGMVKDAINVNIETVGAGKLAVIEREKHNGMVYSPEVVEIIKSGGRRRGFDLEEVAITFGGTDSYAIIKGGGKSACLFGMDETRLFSLWHSPEDNPKNVSEERLADALSVCLGVIEEVEGEIG